MGRARNSLADTVADGFARTFGNVRGAVRLEDDIREHELLREAALLAPGYTISVYLNKERRQVRPLVQSATWSGYRHFVAGDRGYYNRVDAELCIDEEQKQWVGCIRAGGGNSRSTYAVCASSRLQLLLDELNQEMRIHIQPNKEGLERGNLPLRPGSVHAITPELITVESVIARLKMMASQPGGYDLRPLLAQIEESMVQLKG